MDTSGFQVFRGRRLVISIRERKDYIKIQILKSVIWLSQSYKEITMPYHNKARGYKAVTTGFNVTQERVRRSLTAENLIQ